MAAMAGNRPPAFFKFTSPQKVDSWHFETKDYKALPPKTYKKDWELMSPWNGAYIYGGISFGIENPDEFEVGGTYIGYGINISSHIYPYDKTEDDALQRGDAEYFKKRYRWIKPEDKVSIEHHGKENYPCLVVKQIFKKRGRIEKLYRCFKHNKEKTKEKEVSINFIYTHSSNLPKRYERLAKEYTYEDLLKRGKRVLDSLYIKDGWDE